MTSLADVNIRGACSIGSTYVFSLTVKSDRVERHNPLRIHLNILVEMGARKWWANDMRIVIIQNYTEAVTIYLG